MPKTTATNKTRQQQYIQNTDALTDTTEAATICKAYQIFPWSFLFFTRGLMGAVDFLTAVEHLWVVVAAVTSFRAWR